MDLVVKRSAPRPLHPSRFCGLSSEGFVTRCSGLEQGARLLHWGVPRTLKLPSVFASLCFLGERLMLLEDIHCTFGLMV